ncbi:unnamed protein product [Prunus armeniaca]|uniref:Acetyltransferase n=1 Tax=Prunus armeniaca TaxID=36596 RepID=A0A6J5VGX9_PRUAR|nr:unnamed protein product [Prunus armeniaca]
MTRIRQISTNTIRPTNHNDQLSHRIELTPWDLRLIQLDYIQKGLLFQKPAELEQSNSLIQHLQATLSQTLNIFYPLAGRLAVIENEDNTTCFSINCNGDGALFVHAAADGVKVADVLDSVYVPDDIVNNLFSMKEAWNYEGISKPLLAAQVTELVDGIFIGCSINHTAADGTSFWHFFNTWSEISRLGGYDKIYKPHPVLGRQFHEEVIDLPIHLPSSYVNEIKSKQLIIGHGSSSDSLRRVVFHFPKEKVAWLKSKANAEMGTIDSNISISSLQALMAHLWRAITRGRHLNPDQEVAYRIAVGLRQRLNPPLPKEYLGNALLGVIVKCTAGELLEHGLGWAASQINKTIASLTAEEARKYMEDWVKAPTFLSNVLREPTNVELITGSSPRFNVYGNDFGWGRPVAVRSGIPERKLGKLTVFPGPEDGSIDFEACLLTETLRAMADDAEFMEAVLT